MKYQHKDLAAGRWAKLSFLEQMANIGSEVERAILWREKRNFSYSQMAFERALELIDLTVSHLDNKRRFKELMRVREFLIDYFFGDNVYGATDALWRNYFYPFTYTARINK